MENKKTKLTISGNPKKSFKDFEFIKNSRKKNCTNRKKSSRPITKGNFNKSSSSKSSPNFSRSPSSKPYNPSKTSIATSDFERRKLAEQRATKKIKNDSEVIKKQK